MIPETARFLLGDEGRRLIESIHRPVGDSLKTGTILRRDFPQYTPDILNAAIEIAGSRDRASGLYTRSEDMYFTRESLEQATVESVAGHRAGRFRGTGRVVDVCSGIGGDAISLAGACESLICIDRDQARLMFCRENCRVYGRSIDCVCADASYVLSRPGEWDAVFIDPSRRSGGRRTSRLDTMAPPWPLVREIIASIRNAAVKLSPAANVDAVSPYGECEFVERTGILREFVLWSGGFRSCASRATLIDEGVSITGGDLPDVEPGVHRPGTVLYEPGPALIRSGLLGRYAASLGMWFISPGIAWLSADRELSSPFLTGYRVLDDMPWNLRKLRRLLRDRRVGPLTVKKRGFPLLPEEVISRLGLNGTEAATIVVTRMNDAHWVFLVERIDG